MFDDLPERVSRDLAAGLLGVSSRSLSRWEDVGYGPTVERKLEGRRLVTSYKTADVLEWRGRSDDLRRKPGRKATVRRNEDTSHPGDAA